MRNRAVSRRKPTSGFILAFVLICLTVITLALTAMVSRVSLGRRQVIQRQRQVQAQWLAESAVDRAAAQLQRDPSYRGESWQLSAAEMGDRWSAQVSIEVEPAAGEAAGTIRVTVAYPQESRVAIHCTKHVPVRIPDAGNRPEDAGRKNPPEPPLAQGGGGGVSQPSHAHHSPHAPKFTT